MHQERIQLKSRLPLWRGRQCALFRAELFRPFRVFLKLHFFGNLLAPEKHRDLVLHVQNILFVHGQYSVAHRIDVVIVITAVRLQRFIAVVIEIIVQWILIAIIIAENDLFIRKFFASSIIVIILIVVVARVAEVSETRHFSIPDALNCRVFRAHQITRNLRELPHFWQVALLVDPVNQLFVLDRLLNHFLLLLVVLQRFYQLHLVMKRLSVFLRALLLHVFAVLIAA